MPASGRKEKTQVHWAVRHYYGGKKIYGRVLERKRDRMVLVLWREADLKR